MKDGQKDAHGSVGDVVIAGDVQGEEVAQPPDCPPVILDLEDPRLVGELGVEVFLPLVAGLLPFIGLGPQA